MRGSFTISVVAHVLVLLLCVVTLASSSQDAAPVRIIPVTTISAADFTKLTEGVKNAAKADATKPLADKVDAPKAVEQLAPKVADKPEITTDAAAAKAEPQPKPPEKREKKPAEFKPDQIADLLKKDEAKKPPKPQDKPDKSAEDSPKFDANQVAALLDKRQPQRQVASAAALNASPDLGAANGQAAQLSQSEIDALRERIRDCWSPPAGVDPASDIFVKLRVLFKPDGSLAYPPTVVAGTPSAMGPAFAESAKRALLLCQPFTMLKSEHYDQWKDIEFTFTPHELAGG